MSTAKRQRHHIQITADIGQLLIDVDSKETEISHPDHNDIGQLLVDVDSKETETSHPDHADICQLLVETAKTDITSRSC